VRDGKAIAAFALSEPDAGSDVAAMSTTATRLATAGVLDGEKTWISNGGIADLYVVFARTGEAPGARGISAFIVPADAPGLSIAERIDVIAPHPLATLLFEDCRLPADALIGEPGQGFAIAMATSTSSARRWPPPPSASPGAPSTRRWPGEGPHHVRRPARRPPADPGRARRHGAAIDAAALLVYRAAWAKDQGKPRGSPARRRWPRWSPPRRPRRSSTGRCRSIGGLGVKKGMKRSRNLYREIRALRIYEGATEVQKVVIASAISPKAEAAASKAAG
jgi:acyl-CoA dehydrogenase